MGLEETQHTRGWEGTSLSAAASMMLPRRRWPILGRLMPRMAPGMNWCVRPHLHSKHTNQSSVDLTCLPLVVTPLLAHTHLAQCLCTPCRLACVEIIYQQPRYSSRCSTTATMNQTR